MIERPARVTRLESELAWVRGSTVTCEPCERGEGCGGGLLARLVRAPEMEFPALNPLRAMPGESVVVGLPERHLLSGAARLYGIPLAGLLAGAVAGNLAISGPGAGQDAAAAGGALLGAWCALRLARRIGSCAIEAVVLKRGVRTVE